MQVLFQVNNYCILLRRELGELQVNEVVKCYGLWLAFVDCLEFLQVRDSQAERTEMQYVYGGIPICCELPVLEPEARLEDVSSDSEAGVDATIYIHNVPFCRYLLTSADILYQLKHSLPRGA